MSTLTGRILSVSSHDDTADVTLDKIAIDGEPIERIQVSLVLNLARFDRHVIAGKTITLSGPLIEDRLAGILLSQQLRQSARRGTP